MAAGGVIHLDDGRLPSRHHASTGLHLAGLRRGHRAGRSLASPAPALADAAGYGSLFVVGTLLYGVVSTVRQLIAVMLACAPARCGL